MGMAPNRNKSSVIKEMAGTGIGRELAEAAASRKRAKRNRPPNGGVAEPREGSMREPDGDDADDDTQADILDIIRH
jgi:hypothetical protein